MKDNKLKFKNADEEAKYYFDREMALSDKSRFSNVLLIILSLGFIFAFAIAFWIVPDNDFSPEENRTLAQMPELTWENFFSGKLTDEVTDYMADQFPLRNYFVGFKAVGEVAQLKLQNNDVILAKDNYLVARNDYPDEDVLKLNIQSSINFKKACDKRDISCVFGFAGRKIDVLDNKISPILGSYYSDRIWGILDEDCGDDISYINLREMLREKAQNGEEVYYRNDHHWNCLGAYYAYNEVIKAFGETPYDLTDFTKEVATEDFFGTTWSSSGVKWVKGDEIDYYHFDGDDEYTMRIQEASHEFDGYEGCEYVEIDGKEYAQFNSYFVREFLNEKDKYASFIGGNFGFTEIIDNNNPDKETIVILKDSFSHSMVQFLARHYNLVLIDLRYYDVPIIKYCEEHNITKVLFLYNMETLTEGSYLKVLNAGLN